MIINILIISICLVNLILTFFIGLFLVRFQQSIFSFLNNFENFLEPSPVKEENKNTKSKTWDQKYEEELAVVAERISKNSEL
jgi:hypothetical protein